MKWYDVLVAVAIIITVFGPVVLIVMALLKYLREERQPRSADFGKL